MNSQGKEGYFHSKIILYSIHVFILLIFLLFDSDLSKNLSEGKIYPSLKFIILLLLEVYFYETCSIDPGYVPIQT
jgi:hypothetical protein